MSNVRKEFTSLDRLDMPVRWSEVLQRTPGRMPSPPPRDRGLVAIVAFGLAAASVLLVVQALGPRPRPPVSTRPEGQIAFVRRGDVYVMKPDGTDVHKLAEGPATYPTWSPDGRLLAFAAGEERTQIYVVASEGAAPRRLTNVATPGAYFPMWSQDGSRIGFYAPLQGRPSQLGVMKIDGGQISRIPLPFQSAAFATNPVLSPDFREIVFSMCRGRSCAPQIYVRATDGGPLSQLTEGAPATAPAWSPSGERIAFIRSNAIVVMNADGTDQNVVRRCAPEHCLSVNWTPDGTELSVTQTLANPDACTLPPTTEIFELCFHLESNVYLMEADGSKAVHVGSGLWASVQPLP